MSRLVHKANFRDLHLADDRDNSHPIALVAAVIAICIEEAHSTPAQVLSAARNEIGDAPKMLALREVFPAQRADSYCNSADAHPDPVVP